MKNSRIQKPHTVYPKTFHKFEYLLPVFAAILVIGSPLYADFWEVALAVSSICVLGIIVVLVVKKTTSRILKARYAYFDRKSYEPGDKAHFVIADPNGQLAAGSPRIELVRISINPQQAKTGDYSVIETCEPKLVDYEAGVMLKGEFTMPEKIRASHNGAFSNHSLATPDKKYDKAWKCRDFFIRVTAGSQAYFYNLLVMLPPR